MDIHRYISEFSEFSKFQTVKLDAMDELYLVNIFQGYTSVYEIYKGHKNGPYPLAYKNVHRRIRRLFEAGLLEEIKKEGGYKHGARNYKLSDRALVYLIAGLEIPKDVVGIIMTYSESPFIKTFFEPYFEKKSLKYASYSLLRMIEGYLSECCQKIRHFLGPKRLHFYDSNKERAIHILELQLKWHIRSSIVRIATFSEEFIEFDINPRQKTTANERRKTFDLLSKDKKFMKALEEFGIEFNKGYQELIELKSKNR